MKKTFGHVNKYHSHPKHIEDLCWSFNTNILPYIVNHNTGSPNSKANNDQVSHNMFDLVIKPQSSCMGANKQQSTS